jgi:hypothetical protein
VSSYLLFSLGLESWFLSPALEFPQSSSAPLEHGGSTNSNRSLFFGGGCLLLAFPQLYRSFYRFDTPTEFISLSHF